MKAEIKKCGRCGKIFSSFTAKVCLACEPAEEEDYSRIRELLRETPGLSAEDVAEGARVTLECVLRMLETGRIQNEVFSDPVKCGRCGAPAISLRARLCQACLSKLDSECLKAMSELKASIHPKAGDVKTETHEVRRAVDEKRRLVDINVEQSPLDRKRRKKSSSFRPEGM